MTTNIHITEGGVFGASFDPLDVIRTSWGTLEFEFTGCLTGHAWVKPNQEMLAAGRGFETFDFLITRLTQPESCP